MKKIILAAIAVSMASTPAFAASSDTKDFDINARVTPECSMENPSNINMGSLSINRAPGSDALLLNDVAANSGAQSVWVSCNYVTDIVLETLNKGLVTTSPVTDTAQFTNKIFYGLEFAPTTPGAFEGSSSHKPRVQANPRTFTQTKEFHDQAKISVTLEALNVNNKRPVAGTYSDTVTITLGTI
jgi:spore coat protein U-like protein